MDLLLVVHITAGINTQVGAMMAEETIVFVDLF